MSATSTIHSRRARRLVLPREAERFSTAHTRNRKPCDAAQVNRAGIGAGSLGFIPSGVALTIRSMSASCVRIADSSHATASRRAAGPSTRGSIKKRAQPLRERVRFFQSAIDENETLTILKRALPGNCTSCSAAGANYHHSQIAQIDREFAANGAQESFAVGI